MGGDGLICPFAISATDECHPCAHGFMRKIYVHPAKSADAVLDSDAVAVPAWQLQALARVDRR